MIDHEFTIDGLRLERDRLLAINGVLVDALQRIMLDSDRQMAKGGDKFDYQDTNRYVGDIARAALAKANHD